MYHQKVHHEQTKLEKNYFFIDVLKVTNEKSRIRVR